MGAHDFMYTNQVIMDLPLMWFVMLNLHSAKTSICSSARQSMLVFTCSFFFLKCENAYLDNKICTLHYSHFLIFFTKKQILHHFLQTLGRLGVSATSVSLLSWALWKRSYRSALRPDVSFPWCVDILGQILISHLLSVNLEYFYRSRRRNWV